MSITPCFCNRCFCQSASTAHCWLLWKTCGSKTKTYNQKNKQKTKKIRRQTGFCQTCIRGAEIVCINVADQTLSRFYRICQCENTLSSPTQMVFSTTSLWRETWSKMAPKYRLMWVLARKMDTFDASPYTVETDFYSDLDLTLTGWYG